MRPRIYVSGPITIGDLQSNLRQAYAAIQQLMRASFAVLCPHLTCHLPGHQEFPHQAWIDNDLSWVEVAHAVLRLPGESTGADAECEHAASHGIPVYHSIEELVDGFAEELLR